MVLLYKRKKLCVCEIKEVIGLSQPTISSHLKILENVNLVKSFREGKWINYKVHENLEKEKKQYLEFLISMFKDNNQTAADVERAKKADRFCLWRAAEKKKKDIA